MIKKQDLKSLTRKELIKWFEKNNLQKFRAKQVFNWLYRNGVDHFAEMSNLPGKLQDSLKEKANLSNLNLIDKKIAADGTAKYLWGLADSEQIESVYLPFADGRNSVCISSQVGCAMGCQFCATGVGGLSRDLTTGEIVDQILKIQQDISSGEYGEPRISNVVFMGMGEPLANLDSVLKAVDIINDEKGFNIGMRHITISTSGLIPEMMKLADQNLQLVLAVSLNAPTDELRNRIMPINRKYSLNQLFKAVDYYINKTGRRITFEYVLIGGVNDTNDMAHKTASLLAGKLCHVNLIPLNPVDEFGFKSPKNNVVKSFREILQNQGIETTIRQERGTNIEAACGQLRCLHS